MEKPALDIKEYQKAVQLLNANNAVNSMLVKRLPKKTIVEETCKLLVETGGFTMCWIGEADVHSKLLLPIAIYGDKHKYVESIQVYIDERPEGMGPTGKAFRERKSIVANHASRDLSLAPWKEERSKTNYKSSIAVPIGSKDKSWAVLCVYSNEEGYFSQKEADLLEALAQNIHMAVETYELKTRLILNEQRLQNVLEGSFIGTWERNLSTNECIVNEIWAQMLGYTKAELEPVTFDVWRKLVHHDDVIKAEKELEAHYSGLTPYYAVDIRMRHKDGSWRWIYDKGKVVQRLANGIPLLMLGTHTDITERKKIENELINSEEKFRNIFNNTDVGLVLNASDGSRMVNEALANMLGYTEKEMGDLDLSQFTEPEDYQLYNNIRLAHLNGELPFNKDERKYIHKNGSIVWAKITSKVHTDLNSGQTYVISAFTDITESKKMMQALLRSEQKFKNVFEHTLTGLSFNDASGKLNVNQAYADMLGYTVEELNQKSWQEITHPEDLEAGIASLQMMVDGETEYGRREKRYIHKNGGAVWVDIRYKLQRDEDGRPSYLITSVNDVTKTKLTELALRESEEKFRVLFEQASVGVALVDLNSGQFVRVNLRYAELTGYSVSEMESSSFQSITHPDDADLHVNFAEKLKTGEINEFTIEKRYITKAGKTVWVELFISAMRKPGSNPDYNITIATDITFRKEAEILQKQNEELLVAKQNAEIAARLSEEFSQKLNLAKQKAEESDALKTAFLQNISHEVRTPLNAIMGFSNLIKNPGLPAEKIQRYAGIISGSSNQLLSIVNDVLTISSLETKQVKVNFSEFSVNELLDDLHAILSLEIRNPGIQLQAKKNSPLDSLVLNSDRTKITQILTNLVNNAIRFTEKGQIEFGYAVEGEVIKFFVLDTGPGIPKEKQEIIFERFQQGDISIAKKYGGTGLGLSISQAFVELLGGKIWVESEVGRGSTFFFTLPYSAASKEKKSKVPSFENAVPTILIAEDIEINYLFLEELLREKNCRILRALNGEEAVNACKREEIDLVLMDIKMPVLDGIEASRQIKAIKPELPIIAQSGFPLDPVREGETRILFSSYINKPINRNELFITISKYLGAF